MCDGLDTLGCPYLWHGGLIYSQMLLWWIVPISFYPSFPFFFWIDFFLVHTVVVKPSLITWDWLIARVKQYLPLNTPVCLTLCSTNNSPCSSDNSRQLPKATASKCQIRIWILEPGPFESMLPICRLWCLCSSNHGILASVSDQCLKGQTALFTLTWITNSISKPKCYRT